MTFNEAQILFSKARIHRYLRACEGDKRIAMRLYRYNARLSQDFFGILSVFEIALRNSINDHYLKTLGEDWIIKQAKLNGLLEHEAEEVHDTESVYKKEGVYSHDKMVGSFTFGFWTYLFTKRNYKVGGKTLLQIFPHRPKGTTQKSVYSDITSIREFRNRIAHHEPICFDKEGNVNAIYMKKHYQLMKDYLSYMGWDVKDVLKVVECPDEGLDRLERLRKEVEMYKKHEPTSVL